MTKKTQGLDFHEAERHYWNPNVNPKRTGYGLTCDPTKGRTKQSFKAECDINTIMRKYLNTGTIPQGLQVGRYGDFSEAGDYLDALTTIKAAEAQFNALPAQLRKKLDHDPAKFLEYIADPANREEMKKLGFLTQEAIARDDKKAADELARQKAAVKVETLK